MAEGRYEKGFLVPALKCASDWLKPVLPMGWLAWIWPGRFENPSPSATEAYVLGWLGIEIAITAALLGFYDYVAAVSWVVYVFAALHGFEIILRAMAVDLRDVISTVRTLTLAAINYVQLMLWFGLVYALNYQNLIDQSHTLSAALWFQRPVPAEPITAFYFSIITQLTIGYGDVYATGWLRTIAALQGLIGALFVIVVLARAVAAAPIEKDRRQRWPAKPPRSRSVPR
jgi:hypothetical protein